MKKFLIGNLFFNYLFLCLIAGGLFFNALNVYAQEELKSALKDVAGKINKLAEVKKDADLTEQEKEQKEIQARAEALNKVLSLTLLEDEDLKNKLNNLKDLNAENEKTRDALLGLLEENKNVYGTIRDRLVDDITPSEVKELAKDFKDWHTLVYIPKTENIVAFTLVFQEKTILNLTGNRLEKIKLDLEKLENANLIKNEDTQVLFAEAVARLKKAESLNEEASILVMENITVKLFPMNALDSATSTEAVLAATSTPSGFFGWVSALKAKLIGVGADNATATATVAVPVNDENTAEKKPEFKIPVNKDAVGKKQPPTVKSLVQESLKQVKETYKIFSEISKIVKEKVGLE